MFSSIRRCCIFSPCRMTNNVQMAALHFNPNCICNKLFLCCALNPKHPKTTKLNLNTTKEEGDGNKLPLPSSLEQHHRKKRWHVATPSSSSQTQKRKPHRCFFLLFLKHRKEGDNNLSSPSLFQQHHKKSNDALPSFFFLTQRRRQQQKADVTFFVSTPP